MKIALFVHCFYPAHFYGTETYTLELARNLRTAGHDVTVVSATFPGEPPQGALLSRYEYEGIPVVSIDKNLLPNVRIRDTYYQREMVPILGSLIDELKPDIVHVTHLINHTAALLEALAARPTPVVATFTDFFGFCYNNRLESHRGRLCEGPSSTRINCIACHVKAAASARQDWRSRMARKPAIQSAVAASMYALQRLPGALHGGRLAAQARDVVERPSLLRALYAHYGLAIVPTRFTERAYVRSGFPRPIVRIPFGVDIPRHAKPPRPEGPLKLGFIGQMMEHKGPDLLLDAARTALGTHGYEILLYGSEDQAPDYSQTLHRRAEGLPVRFMGSFPPARMREVFDGLDALVIPSRWYENSPLVLLNALASHTPVLVSDVEGMTEFVEDGVNGMAFARGDVRALAGALQRLHGDPAMLRHLSANARYDPTTRSMADATLAVYERARHNEASPAVRRATGERA